MQLRSPFEIAPPSWDWRRISASRPRNPYRARGWAMARQHPEELGVVLRLVAVMTFFGVMTTLLFWFAG